MGLETNEKHQLYIRFPVNIEDECIIKELHPAIIQVILPRQKSRRWCGLTFETNEKLEEAASVLKRLRIENKSIKIRKSTKKAKEIKRVAVPSVDSTKSLLNLLNESS